MATPYLCRPIEWGADIVVHSATKFLGGHGNSLGGVVVESGRFDWGNGRFPVMTEPVPSYGGLSWWGNFGEYAFCTRLRAEQLRDLGPALAPGNAFLLLQGVETLPQRMDAHVANTHQVAQFLTQHPAVPWVNWAGLPDHPDHERARRYLPLGPGAVLSFGVHGGRDAASRLVESVELCSHLANIGDARSLIIHPASTTHRQLSDAALAAAGVPADLVRLSVGIEDADDILWDLDRALRRRPRVADQAAAWSPPSITDELAILRATRTVAIVGMSADPSRPSHFVATYLLSSSTDFEAVWFVNPRGGTILDRPVYPSLTDLPAAPDLVDVFRRTEDLPAVADEVVALDGVDTLWVQLGLWSEDAAELVTPPVATSS